MKQMWATLAAGMMAALAQPAAADVKTGVDAWQQGDYAKAVAEWQPLAQAGDPDAQFNMGQAYKLGRGVSANMGTAIQWYRKAAEQGHVRAEDNLGLLMFQQGDRASALPYLQRAANRGEPRAQYIVGTALFNGDLTPKDWVRAYALMTRASAAGLAQATASLKQMDKYIPAAQRQQGAAMANEAGRKDLAALDQDDRRDKKGASVPATAPTPARKEASPPAESKRAAAPLPPAAAPKPVEKAAPVKAAPPAKPASGPWRVQLGAFSEEGRARALWNKLKGQVGGLSAYQLFLVKGGAVTKLQAGPLSSSAEAARLCGAIKAAGAECMPRKM
ncbi:Sel1-like TPR repeat protein [Sphingomonas paucimobilis]|nr:Sel1-like TPR repeat protein [Sphingomonas paucimobilis]